MRSGIQLEAEAEEKQLKLALLNKEVQARFDAMIQACLQGNCIPFWTMPDEQPLVEIERIDVGAVEVSEEQDDQQDLMETSLSNIKKLLKI